MPADLPREALAPSSKDPLLYFLSLLKDEQAKLSEAVTEVWSKQLAYLNAPAESRPPQVINDQMRRVFLASDTRSLLMERQLRAILRAFEHEGIDALVLKGPALAATVYPHPATRLFSDIDLLVRPDQFLKAREALFQLGYYSQSDRFETFQELFNAEPFFHSSDSENYFIVDLHWSLFQYHGIKRNNGVGEFFGRSVTVKTPTIKFDTLDKVDAFIYAAFHLVLHHAEYVRLIWVADIALLAQSLVYPDEWEVLRQRCSTLKLSLAMQESLKLAQRWYGIQLPEPYEEFANWLSPKEDERAEVKYLSRKGGPDIRLKGYFADFLSAPGKVRFLLRFLFPTPEHIRITYPPSRKWLLPLSYIRRWGSWIAKVFQYAFHTLALKD
jgi:hypothetical protein